MSSFICKHCSNNRNRNFVHNEVIAEAVASGSKQLVSGILRQYDGKGLEILTETLTLYVPGVTEQVATELTEPEQFQHCEIHGVHIPLHYNTGDVLAIPAKDITGEQTVMLVQLTSDPENRHLAGHYAYSPLGTTSPVHGCIEGIYRSSMLRVDGALERPSCTRPLHTICRTFRLLGYLSRSSDQFNKIVDTQQVATSKHFAVDLAHILASMEGAPSNSSASSVTSEETCVDFVCKCDPANGRMIQEMLDEVHIKHKGVELESIEGCVCPFCTTQLLTCYTCMGVCLNTGKEGCV